MQRVQLERQQGLGREIASTDGNNGLREVRVGNRTLRGRWITFHDFLFDYIKSALGYDWGKAELATPVAQRHPIMYWCEVAAKQLLATRAPPGTIGRMPMTGAIAAYLTLAYDLYTLEHNASQANDPALQAKLIARLKHKDQFVGARHEIRTAAIFFRAGFQLEWEDETSRSKRHCEFSATYPATGRTFGVECKIRQPQVASTKIGKFGSLLVDAPSKETPHERIVFLDLNTPAQERAGNSTDWQSWAVGRTRRLETDPKLAKLPPAYILLTIFPHHYHLEAIAPRVTAVAEGFKISDYKHDWKSSLREAIESRERHAEMEALVQSAMSEHTQIPSTFDGSIAELGQGRLLVGHRYQMDDGKVGVLTQAVVHEERRVASLMLEMSTGEHSIYEATLSPEEYEAWKRYPDVFFGEVGSRKREARDALDLYDSFLEVYRRVDKARLLSFMNGWPNQDSLREMDQLRLAKTYSESLANNAAALADSRRQ